MTVPHKERVAGLVDRLDAAAAAIGAVNTIVRENGSLAGYNTDAYGFITSLKAMAGFDPRGKRAVLLGAGGAARAAVFALAEEGVRSLVIANRTLERAESLAAGLGGAVPDVAAVPLGGARPGAGRRRCRPDRQLHLGGNAGRRRWLRFAAAGGAHPCFSPRVRHGVQSRADTFA